MQYFTHTRITFTINGERQFVPNDQVFSLYFRLIAPFILKTGKKLFRAISVMNTQVNFERLLILVGTPYDISHEASHDSMVTGNRRKLHHRH